MAKVPNGIEKLPKMSTGWVGCSNVTDRRLTDRQTNGDSISRTWTWACEYVSQALHCCKAHSKLIGKMENSTPCKIVTPENFILKLGTRDYVENVTHYTNFRVHRFSKGFSTNRWNMTLLWLFSCPVLSCPVLSFFSRSHAQHEPLDRFSRFMAQMTWFRTRMVLFGVRTMIDII